MPRQTGRPSHGQPEDWHARERKRERLVLLMAAAQRLTTMAQESAEFRSHAHIVGDVAADIAAEIVTADALSDVARIYRVLFTQPARG